jgi:prolipoprotein diacylglyceryl transferase
VILQAAGTAPGSIPSPDQAVWHLGPLPLRAYALCILVGILVAIWVTDRRWVARGGRAGLTYDVAMWAVPFGIIGGRIYHVLTDWPIYFGPGGSGLSGAVAIWEGGLGIWGAVSLGAVGAWIGCRRSGVPLPPFADALAVGLPLAQAIGRLGNWFNQELFGAPSELPWALEIDPVHRPVGYEQYETFHPTFLYEGIWLVGVAVLVAWADRRWRLGHGRAFAVYVAVYCVGRLGVEMLRIDPVTEVGGLRLNVYTSVLVGLGAVVYLLISARRRPGREDASVLMGSGSGAAEVSGTGAAPESAAQGSSGDAAAGESAAQGSSGDAAAGEAQGSAGAAAQGAVDEPQREP